MRTDFINEHEAAQMVGYAPSTLRKYVKEKKILCVVSRPSKSKFMYNRYDLVTYIKMKAIA